MAISPEDHKDVKNHLGKALANKVKKVTNDSKMSKKYGATFGDLNLSTRHKEKIEAGRQFRQVYSKTGGAPDSPKAHNLMDKYRNK
jgi:hypothetical protein